MGNAPLAKVALTLEAIGKDGKEEKGGVELSTYDWL